MMYEQNVSESLIYFLFGSMSQSLQLVGSDKDSVNTNDIDNDDIITTTDAAANNGNGSSIIIYIFIS
jgi:hypothetical protein